MPVLPVTPARSGLSRQLAVIGGGWSGMAAAIALTEQGHRVSVFEAARQWGGRARALEIKGPQGETFRVDNGQHILIGAYAQSLQCMRKVGVDPETALLRLPLDLRYANGHGLRLPDLPPPWDALIGIASAKGWSLYEKTALLRRAARWQRAHFRCGAHETVADLCQGLPARLLQDFIDPLCISALNLPADAASGPIFLRILQDSLFSGRGGSNLLIPRTDLSTLFAASAAHWVIEHGGQAQLGQRAHQLRPLVEHETVRWQVDGAIYDGVVLATNSTEAARLALSAAAHWPEWQSACETWAARADSLPHTAITTVYAYCPATRPNTLPAPMVALHASADSPAQFAFDRGQLGGPPGLLALVISASHGTRLQLEQQTLEQARQQLGLPQLRALKTVVEKRATFTCIPEAQRPTARIAPGLWACGDYIEGPYPATLEGAILSGLELARAFEHLTDPR